MMTVFMSTKIRTLFSRSRSTLLAIVGVFLLLMASATMAQTLREDQGLFDKPDGTQSATKIKAGTAVKPLKRQGFWVEVQIGAASGWLKVSMVNFGGASGGPTAIDTGRLGTGNIVSTSATRGLSAKDLINGKPNFDELQKLELLNADGPAVLAFMSEGNVKPIEQKISLAPPAKAAPVASTGAPSGNAGAGGVPTKQKKDDDW